MWRTSATQYLIHRHEASKAKLERDFVIRTDNPFKPLIARNDNTNTHEAHARAFMKNSARQKHALMLCQREEMPPPSREALQIARIKSAALRLLRDTRKQQDQEREQRQQHHHQQLSEERRHSLDYSSMVEYMGAQEHFFATVTSANINVNGLHHKLKSSLTPGVRVGLAQNMLK